MADTNNRELVDSREADYAGYDNYVAALEQQMADQLDQEQDDREWKDEEESEVGFDHIDEYFNEPTEYEEWQGLYGGDDCDHGQYDSNDY